MSTNSVSPLYFVASVTLVAGLILLAWYALAQYSIPCLSVEQLQSFNPSPNEQVQVFGIALPPFKQILPSSHKDQKIKETEPHLLSFLLADMQNKKSTLPVFAFLPKPPALAPGLEVFVTGTFDPKKKSLAASQIITKCPSKYRSKLQP